MSRAYDNPFRAGVGNCRQIKARRRKTVEVLKDWIPRGARCLDLGPPNPLGLAIEDAMCSIPAAGWDGPGECPVRGCVVTYTGTDDLDTGRIAIGRRNYELGPFDAIFAFEVLEHLFSPLQALLRCRKILSETGLVFVTIPQRPAWLRVRGHYHEMDHFRWCELVKRAGYRIIHEERWPIAWNWPTGIRPIIRMLIARHYFCVLVKEGGKADGKDS